MRYRLDKSNQVKNLPTVGNCRRVGYNWSHSTKFGLLGVSRPHPRLEVVSEKGCTEVEARGDSQLVVKQVRGEWSMNEPELRPLRDRVQELAEEFKQFEIQHVSRHENWEADELVKVGFSD